MKKGIPCKDPLEEGKKERESKGWRTWKEENDQGREKREEGYK